MLLAGTNFIIHYYILTRNLKKITQNEELKLYIVVIVVLGLIISSTLYFRLNKPLEESFREGFFQIISIITCTGYSTADYLLWPQTAWIILFFAMFLGGSTGSTSGGIKIARHLVVIKNIHVHFRRLITPNAIFTLRLNNITLNNDTNGSILSFISVYFLICIIGTLLLVLIGIDGKTASSSVATSMAGIGPGLGMVGPASNFASLPGIAKLVLSFLMLIGRLEIYTIVILFTGNFWKK
jgi:trk system potassium uptake protein TrkH